MDFGVITHHLPQFLLSRFRVETLFELDLSTGSIKSSSLLNAGSRVDAWPEEIEHGMMQRYDNTAARILRQKIWGNTRRTIEMTLAERNEFACWLALFMPRVPIVFEAFQKFREKMDADPEIAVRAVYESRDESLKVIRSLWPLEYDRIITMLGREVGEDHLMAFAAERIRRREIPYLPDPVATHRQHLIDVQSELVPMAARLVELHWTWYRTASGFCIGDNPLCRWDVSTQASVWGVPSRNDVEVTFPVSADLTVCMSGKYSCHEIRRCGRKQTRQFNYRQKIGSFKHVYAGAREFLDPRARFGFDAESPPTFRRRELRLPPLSLPEE